MQLRSTVTPRARCIALLLATLTIAGATVAKAGTVTCSVGPGCLNATQTINWETNFPGEYTSIPNGSTAVSDSGLLAAMITFSGGGDGIRMNQGSGWIGNFADGAALAWTGSPGQGPITLEFSQPVTAVGFQIQADFLGPFTAGMLAYDSQGNLIGSALVSGNSNANGDGSAAFLGLTANNPITSVIAYQATCACDNTDFAMGQVSVTPAPEPGTFTLFVLAAGTAALLGRGRESVDTLTTLELQKGKV